MMQYLSDHSRSGRARWRRLPRLELRAPASAPLKWAGVLDGTPAHSDQKEKMSNDKQLWLICRRLGVGGFAVAVPAL